MSQKTKLHFAIGAIEREANVNGQVSITGDAALALVQCAESLVDRIACCCGHESQWRDCCNACRRDHVSLERFENAEILTQPTVWEGGN